MTIWHTVNWLSRVMWIRQVKGGWPLPRIDETLLTCGTCFSSCSVPCGATSSRDLLLKLVGILVFIEHHRHDIKLKIYTASQKEDLHDLVWKFQVISIKIIGMALTPIPEPHALPFYGSFESNQAITVLEPSVMEPQCSVHQGRWRMWRNGPLFMVLFHWGDNKLVNGSIHKIQIRLRRQWGGNLMNFPGDESCSEIWRGDHLRLEGGVRSGHWGRLV